MCPFNNCGWTLINLLNILPNQKIKAVFFGSVGGGVFPLSLIKHEYTEVEDKTKCSPSPGKDMDMRGDSLLLYEENLKNTGQRIANRTKRFNRLGNGQIRFKKNQKIPYDQQNGAG